MNDVHASMAAVATAAREAGGQEDLSEVLQIIVDAARVSVPGFDHAGITLIDADGRIETAAATDDLVWRLDRVQYDRGEGPCVTAMREHPIVVVPRARQEQRWPTYIPEAVGLGLRAQLAVRLFLEVNGSMGGLNLYSFEEEDLHPDAENIADLFAAHAALALRRTRQVEHFNEALHSRKVIGQAVGIVMQRYQLDEDGAFAYLLRASSHGNTKLRTIAEDLVAETSRAHGRPG